MSKSYLVEKSKNYLNSLFHTGFFHILIGSSLVKLIGFVSSIVIVRLVTKEAYANLAYADNIYAYIDLFSGLGLAYAILRFSSTKNDNKSNISYVNEAITIGSVFQLFVTLVVVTIMYLSSVPFEESFELSLALIAYPVLSNIYLSLQNYNRSMLKNKVYVISGIAMSISFLTLSIGAVIYFNIYGVIIARYIGLIIGLIIASRNYLSAKPLKKIPKIDSAQKKAFYIMGLSMMISSMFSMLMPINEMFLLNNIVKDEIITANYKVAVMIPSQLGFITGAFMIYYFPLIALLKPGKAAYIKVKKIGILIMIVIISLSLIGAIITPTIFNFIYGDKYSDAIEFTYLFWGVYAINSGLRMVPLNLLPAFGFLKFNVIMSLVSSSFHFIIAYFLIKRFGIYGAAYSLIIVYAVTGILYWIYLRIRLIKAEGQDYEKSTSN